MRLPITPQISTKDGVSAKNARLTNCLKESKKGGDKAVVRPGLVLDAQASGVGHGLVVFNNELVSVYGATLGLNTEAGSAGFTTYPIGLATGQSLDSVFISSGLWAFSVWDSDLEEGYVYSGDPESSISENSIGFVGSTGGIYGMASSGTSLVVANDTVLYRTATGGPFSFSLKVGPTTVFSEVYYKSGRYVAIGGAYATTMPLWYSVDDGVNWTSASITTGATYESSARGVTFDGIRWLVVGYTTTISGGSNTTRIYSTTDFVSYSELTLSGLPAAFTIYGIYYASGTYFINGLGTVYKVYSSTDAASWTEVATFSGLAVYMCETGDDEVLCSTVASGIYKSSSGTFQVVATGGTYPLLGIASDDTGLVCVGGSFSSDYVVGNLSDGISTIPALTTITGDYYDFAQSPI